MPQQNNLEYTINEMAGTIDLSPEVSEIKHGGVELLSEIKKLRKERRATSEILERQDEILDRIRTHQKDYARRTLWYNSAIILIAVTCLILASWVVNRLNHLPHDTAALNHMLTKGSPRQYEIGQAVVDRLGQKWVVRGADISDNGWIYKLQNEKRQKWAAERYLGPVHVNGERVFYDITGPSRSSRASSKTPESNPIVTE